MTNRHHHEAAHTWSPVDSRRILDDNDSQLLTRLVDALADAGHLALQLPALANIMRDHENGQPRAATYTPSSAPAPHATEDEAEAPTGHTDPTGDAGITHDQARRDERNLRKHLNTAIAAIYRATAIAAAYPAEAATRPEIEATPGEDWCRCCWKDDHYCEPIPLDTTGAPYYRGLCRWCGAFKAREGFEPPTNLVEVHHRGDRVTPGMVATARLEWQRLNTKKGRKKKNRAA